jgi:hypothetical protein
MKILEPQNWIELQEHLFHDSYNEELRRVRSPYIYRGLSDFSYELFTSLIRLGGQYDQLEFHLLRNFKKYAFQPDAVGNTDWDWLASAQHHGLPTRLMDWTYSPYIALHFSTAEIYNFNKDGIVWALNYEKINQFLPDKMKEILKDVGSNSFTSDMLNRAYPTLQALAMEEPEFVFAFEPPSLDSRIVNQYAIFTLMSHANSVLNRWLADKTDLYFVIRIPREMKWEIRDKLDQMNINERVLFPGLDGLSKFLKRQYAPKL